MKNKKLTYFLIAAVAGLWGLIIYRIIGAVNTDDDVAPVTTTRVKEAYNDFSLPKDTAKLLLNYRNPFGPVKVRDTVVSKPEKPALNKTAAVPPVVKPAINWSFINYSGYICNPSTKKLIALVSINGQSTTLAEGESKNQVKLIKNLRDSIKISYEGKTKFIAIKPASP